MGIRGLLSFLLKNSNTSIKKCHINQFNNKTLAIDSGTWIYKYILEANAITKVRNDLFYLKIVDDICFLLKNGIKPVFVFDGKPPQKKSTNLQKSKNNIKIHLKKRLAKSELFFDSTQKEIEKNVDRIIIESKLRGNAVLKKRQLEIDDITNRSQPNLDEAIDENLDERINKILLKSHPETDDTQKQPHPKMAEMKKILKSELENFKKYANQRILEQKFKKSIDQNLMALFGVMKIAFIKAPGEAEATCASFCKNGFVDGVISEDNDALTFGSPRLIRWAHNSINSVGNSIEIDLKKVLKDLDFSMEQFVDMCILSGSDFTQNVEKMNLWKAYHLIKIYGDIESIDCQKRNFEIKEDFDYKSARKIFFKPKIYNKNFYPIRCEKLDLKKIFKFFQRKIGLFDQIVEKSLFDKINETNESIEQNKEIISCKIK